MLDDLNIRENEDTAKGASDGGRCEVMAVIQRYSNAIGIKRER